jgi:hypothetical protein
MRPRLLVVLAAALLAAGCGVKLDQCRALLPVAGEPVALVKTPAGKMGCSCLTEDVVVVVQPERDGLFGWKRGQIWIDGTPVSESEFATKLTEAKTRHRVQGIIDKASAIGRGIRDAIGK